MSTSIPIILNALLMLFNLILKRCLISLKLHVMVSNLGIYWIYDSNLHRQHSEPVPPSVLMCEEAYAGDIVKFFQPLSRAAWLPICR